MISHITDCAELIFQYSTLLLICRDFSSIYTEIYLRFLLYLTEVFIYFKLVQLVLIDIVDVCNACVAQFINIRNLIVISMHDKSE